MKRSLFFIITLFIICTAPMRAYIILKGELVTDSNQPVSDTRITVAGGPSDITDSNGNFQIRLPNDFIEGERVIISVFKKGWVINYPLDGEWNLPNIKYQDVHTTRVIIVPRGSKALWSHARIEKHIAMLSDEHAKKKQEIPKTQPLDFSYYLKEWAEKYGFTPDQVKAQFDEWAEAVKDSDNNSTQGLRYFYLKDLPKAAEEFEKAALQGEEKRKALKEKLRQVDLYTYENWKYSGNVLYVDYQFRKALEKYREAEKIAAREDFPQDWAMTQNNLGAALQDQGIRTGGKEGAALLAEAEAAFRKALEVRTFEHLLLQWAQTQNNLAELYESQENWSAAIDCYQNIYKVYPHYAAYKLASIFQDKVFRFENALEMNLYLLNQDSTDRAAQLRLVESYFTTGRFKEGNQHILRIKDIYSDPSYSLIVIFLKVFEIANFVALNETGKAADQLEILIDMTGKQPQDFNLGWEFTGTKYFIRTNKELEPYRKWLLAFFTALEKKDRDAILAGLTKLRQL